LDHFNLAVSITTAEDIYQAQIPFEDPRGNLSDQESLLTQEMEIKEAGIPFEMTEDDE